MIKGNNYYHFLPSNTPLLIKHGSFSLNRRSPGITVRYGQPPRTKLDMKSYNMSPRTVNFVDH